MTIKESRPSPPGAVHIRDVATDVSTEYVTAGAGIGLWLVIVGGIAMALAAMLRPLPAGSEER